MEVTPDLVVLGAAWFLVFIFSTSLHEAAHAFAAHRLGDDTAYLGGQVSLNPIPHVQREPFGMLLVPLLSFMLYGGSWMIGWASAPYDPSWAYRYPRRSALMALAGPLSNLALVVLAGVLIKLCLSLGLLAPTSSGYYSFTQLVEGGSAGNGLATVLSILFSLNLVLFVFNLFPLPPLDGSAVIQLAMPESLARGYQEIMRNPMWGFIGILAAWRLLPPVFSEVFPFALRLFRF